MNRSRGVVYQFGPFRYDPAQRLLFRGDELIPLVPKAMDTLDALLDRRGQVVGKAELMKLVWPDCVVEDVGLARNVSLLRKALGDDAEKYIETIPRRGYRFAAEVQETAVGRNEAAAGSAGNSPAGAGWRRFLWLAFIAALSGALGLVYWQFYRPSRYLPQRGQFASLAVVPFDCLNRDLERQGFCQGFPDTLAAEISKLKSVQVISPSTVRRYSQLGIPTAIMARLLGLHVVVEGTAQTLGRQIKVTVRLTDVHSGRLIWAEGYDLSAEEMGLAEGAVARAVAEQIGRRLSM